MVARIWINEQAKNHQLRRAGVRGFHMNLYPLIHPFILLANAPDGRISSRSTRSGDCRPTAPRSRAAILILDLTFGPFPSFRQGPPESSHRDVNLSRPTDPDQTFFIGFQSTPGSYAGRYAGVVDRVGRGDCVSIHSRQLCREIQSFIQR